MEASPPLLVWSGTARSGRVRIQAPEGHDLTFTTLSGLAAHLRQRQDPWGGMVRCAAGLGIALHAIQPDGPGDLLGALEEAASLLQGLPVHGVLARMKACAMAHSDFLTPREGAARLVLEAKRIQREHSEGVARVIVSASQLIPTSGSVLLAWPGGPACDLGEGLLTGALIAARPTGGAGGGILVAGPEALAREAVDHLAAHGLDAVSIPAAQAVEAASCAHLACVLLRCVGDRAEPAAAGLAALAAGRGVPVIGLGAAGADESASAALAALPTLRSRIDPGQAR